MAADSKAVFVSWSGGKDSYLSLVKAVESGLRPMCLLTFVNRDKEERSMSHGLPTGLLDEQSRALQLPLSRQAVTWDDYESGFQEAAARLKKEGLGGGVFGDINLPGHRQWVEKACAEAGIAPHLPLWNFPEEEVVAEMLRLDMKLYIVSLRSDLLEEKWLGRQLDSVFVEELQAKGLSPCGENGEYHTLAAGGPLFNGEIEIQPAGVHRQNTRSFLEIHSWRLGQQGAF